VRKELPELHRHGATNYQFIGFNRLLNREEQFRNRGRQLVGERCEQAIPCSALGMPTPEEE
jgi:hypothetical protein